MKKHSRLITRLNNPVVVSVATEETDKLWGIHQFPKIWDGENDEIYIEINKGEDSYGLLGKQYRKLYFKSLNYGEKWTQIDNANRNLQTITFSDGEAIYFDKNNKINIDDNLSPKEVVQSINEMAEFNIYSFADLPEEFKTIQISRKKSGESEFVKETGKIIFDDMYVAVLSGSRLDRANPYEKIEPNYENVFIKNWYGYVTIDKNDNLYTILQSTEPYKGHIFYSAHCLCSKDRGKTWEKTATVCDQHALTKWGTGGDEQQIIVTDSGRLICVLRTEVCIYGTFEDTDRDALVFWSDDKGKTWSKPIIAADSSVTPHLVKLKNGIIALVHGRPGVHVKFSADEGETWNSSIKIVGKTTKEAIEEADKLNIEYNNYIYSNRTETCANTSVASINKNSFLLAYSDFNYPGTNGEKIKAIKIVRVSAERDHQL